MISAGHPVRRLRLAAMAVVAALSCVSPGSEDATTSELNADVPDVDPWQVACLHPSDSARSADSASALVAQAVDLWTSERRAFRAFQSTYCDDCAMFEESAPTFFESSNNLLRRTAERFPTSATVACALGMMHLRNASLGEGRLDEGIVDESVAAFERALSLRPSAELAERVRSELADIQAMRRTP